MNLKSLLFATLLLSEGTYYVFSDASKRYITAPPSMPKTIQTRAAVPAPEVSNARDTTIHNAPADDGSIAHRWQR